MSEKVEKQLKNVFNAAIRSKFSSHIPPDPYVTKTNIRTLDALLGGGISSSSPIMISSAPETGKSSVCAFIAKQFIDENDNAIVIYIDTETTGSSEDENSGINSRIRTLNIPPEQFQFNSLLLDTNGIYDFIKDCADTKRNLEEKLKNSEETHKEINMLIIIDSLAGCPCTKGLTAEDPKEIIGLKSRELSHNLDKIKPILAFSKINLILIDQIRANMVLGGPYTPQNEKSVGVWNNLKTSSGSSVLQHALKLWIYLSKKKELYAGEMGDVQGWILDCRTEKNKLAPSGYSVSLVFDKHQTIHKLYSEYLFLQEMTTTENKYTGRDPKKLPYPLLVKSRGAYKYIECIDPATGKSLGSSDSFYEKDLVKKYNSDPKFKEIFDWAVTTSVEERITKFLLKNENKIIIEEEEIEVIE